MFAISQLRWRTVVEKFITSGEGSIKIGRSSNIADSAQVIFHKPGTVAIGDYCNIGPGVKIICSDGDLSIGDWTTLHDNCLILAGRYTHIGAHCWFGQNCVLDGTGGLTVGNGVRVGMYSQIWSHVAAGEQLEGCTLFGERPVVIEDYVWLVGSCIVASGVTLGRRAVALIGSNITKSWPADSTIAGAPAVSKQGLSFYRSITLDEKWVFLKKWMENVREELRIDVMLSGGDLITITAGDGEEKLIFARTESAAATAHEAFPLATVCCVENKIYNKRFTSVEQRVLKYLSGNKARFFAV